MKCAICREHVQETRTGYVCKRCNLVLPEALVIARKRPIITHFENRQTHKSREGMLK